MQSCIQEIFPKFAAFIFTAAQTLFLDYHEDGRAALPKRRHL
jgi:hypothetical protein